MVDFIEDEEEFYGDWEEESEYDEWRREDALRRARDLKEIERPY